MQAVGQMAAARGASDSTADLFGFDDSALKEAEQMASLAGREQRRLSERLAAVQGAAKRPELVAQEGVNVNDPAALRAKIAEIKQEREAWANWSTNPSLVARVREQVNGVVQDEIIDPRLSEGLTKGTQVGGAKEIADIFDEIQAKTLPANIKRAVRYQWVDDVEAERLQQATGLSFKGGYKHTVDSFAMRHTGTKHGDPREALRGQEPVTREDWARIPEVVRQPDRIDLAGKNALGNALIRYQKRFNGTTYFVEEVRTKRRELAAKSLWKTRTAITDAQPVETAPTPTSEPFSRNLPKAKEMLPQREGIAQSDRSNQQPERQSRPQRTGAPLTASQARVQLVAALGEKRIAALERAGRLKLHETDPTKTGAAGFVDGQGVIHLVASNLEGDAWSVALHEAVHVARDDRFFEGNRAHIQLAHAALRVMGLRNFIGGASFTAIVQQAYRLAASGDPVAQKALAKARSEWDADPRVNVPEEMVAYLVQYADPKAPLVQRILSAIRSALFRMGIKVNLTSEEVRALAVSALKGQAKAAGRVTVAGPRAAKAFSQADQPAPLTVQQRFEYAVAGLKLLVQNPAVFQYPKSTQTDLAAIAQDLSPQEELSVETAFAGRGEKAWVVTMPDGRRARVTLKANGREVFIDASALEKGHSTGSLLYQLVGQWAHNTGKVFIGDPNGITPAGKARRLEHLISLALKFNTTDFLLPHPDQNIPWKVGQHDYNLAQMLKASSDFVQAAVPKLQGIRYDFGSGTGAGRFIESATGRVVGDDDFKILANTPRARESQAGYSTLKRSVLVHTLVQGAGGTGWRSILGALVQQGSPSAVLDPSVKETFYSQPQTPEEAADQARLWQEFQAVRARFQEKQASTTAFERWFGKGIEGITAQNGKPLTLFHGSPHTFYQFDATRAGANSKHPTSGLGFFMTADAGAAYRYGGNVLELHAKLEKPYYLTDADLAGVDSVAQAVALRQSLRAKGFDGAVVSAPGAAPYVIVFESKQVKLTSNQAPTESADFRYARPGQPALSPALPAETKGQAFQRRVQDKVNRFEVLQKWLKDQGVNLTPDANVDRSVCRSRPVSNNCT